MITLDTKQKWKPPATRVKIEQLARHELERHCHFRRRAHDFKFKHDEGVLTVQGRVPTFYLKQLLQTVLKRVDGIERVNNQVDVVCSDGLSSVRNTSSRR